MKIGHCCAEPFPGCHHGERFGGERTRHAGRKRGTSQHPGEQTDRITRHNFSPAPNGTRSRNDFQRIRQGVQAERGCLSAVATAALLLPSSELLKSPMIQ
jgi:hypothetical protein